MNTALSDNPEHLQKLCELLDLGEVGLRGVGVEVRQDLVDSPEGAAHWAGILGDAFDPVMADEALYSRLNE